MIRLALILVIPVAMSLQGCALLAWPAVKPVQIEKKAVERTPLNLADPQPLKPSIPSWIIITPANAEQVWAELRKRNADLVLFALTDDGYEELAADIGQIRNFIAQQREIIVRYRQYYEPPRPAADAK